MARDSGVIPISTLTNRPGNLIKSGLSWRSPDALALTPDGTTLYAEDQVAETVTPIRTATNTALKPVIVAHDQGSFFGGKLGEFAMSPDGKTLYVTHCTESGINGVFPMSTATNTVLRKIRTGSHTCVQQIAIAPGGKTVYLVSSPDGIVFPISMTTGTLRKPIRIGAEFSTTLSSAIAITPNGTTAYVLAQRSKPDRSLVIAISTATGTTFKPIRVGYEGVDITMLPPVRR